MEDADLLFIFKMLAIDFLFIKNEKKNICFAERKHNDNRFFFLGIGLLSLLT